jgi:acyl-CoA synthetase (AMP-forming)/AMP-acid ligase II
VRHRARVTPDAAAVEEGARTTTYAELDRRSSRAAQALRELGTGPGDRVVLVSASSTAALEVVFGAAKLGAIATPINAMLSAPEIAEVLADADPRVVCVDASTAHLVAETGGARLLALDSVQHQERLATGDDTDPGVVAGPDDVCLLLYTSGTTGRPKGIALSCRNLADGLAMLHLGVGLDTTSRVAGPAPFFHIGGFGLALVSLLNGSCQLLGASMDVHLLHRSLVDGRVTHASLVPTLVARLLDVPETSSEDWVHLQHVIYGGSPMPLPVLQRARATFGCSFVQYYGMTESTGGFCVLAQEDHHQRPGESEADLVHRLRSVGKPYVEGSVVVRDPVTLEPVPAGTHGEVTVHGGRVMTGYWNQPSLTAETVVLDGWLRTGDGGSFDAEGYLHLHDRIKDMIVSGGENIYSIEVENVLAAHPAVAECAVVAVPSEKWGESPYAVVVTQPGAEVTAEELIAWCRDRMAHFKCPVGVAFVEDFPRTPIGKIKKAVLRSSLS